MVVTNVLASTLVESKRGWPWYRLFVMVVVVKKFEVLVTVVVMKIMRAV